MSIAYSIDRRLLIRDVVKKIAMESSGLFAPFSKLEIIESPTPVEVAESKKIGRPTIHLWCSD